MLNWLLKPTTELPSRLAKKASDAISPADKEGSIARGFLSGATEGAGKLASDMTSPLSLAMTALGAGGARALGSAGKSIYKAAGPTMDLIEEAPAIKQVMPAMDDVNSLIGDLARNLAKVPSAGSRATGINPAILPPELVEASRGGQAVYNNARSIPNAVRPLEDVAYNTVRSGNDPIRKQIGGGLDLSGMMNRLNQARGR